MFAKFLSTNLQKNKKTLEATVYIARGFYTVQPPNAVEHVEFPASRQGLPETPPSSLLQGNN